MMYKSTPGMMISEQLPSDSVVNLKGLRRPNAPSLVIWVLYYAWVVAFATWWTSSSPGEDCAFDTQIRSLMHVVNLLSSTVFVFIAKKKQYVKVSRIAAAVIIASMLSFYLLPGTFLKIIMAIIGSAGIGCFNICILIPIVFTLNNTEKLYAVVAGNALIQLVALFREHSRNSAAALIVSMVLLVCSLGAALFLKAGGGQDAMEEPADKPELHPRVYLSLVFNCAIVVLCKGAGRGILNIASAGVDLPVLMWYYLGGLAGCVVYVVTYAFTKKAYIWLGNITFSTIAIGLLCNAFVPQAAGLAIPFALLLGTGSTLGMINMYYITGIIAKKYDSMRHLRLSILVIGLCGGLAGITVGNFISWNGTFGISIAASVVSAVVMLAFMFVSPIMAQADYVNDWGRDSNNTDISSGQLSVFAQCGLSKREGEVCELLLQGYTLRQISAILSIAYSTVNTYCTSAYKKLGINSRTELLLRFKDYLVK
jgi:DNA-binding CsgD family transcriptional regulator/uncharacterized protein YhhL (DUF1145 family)